MKWQANIIDAKDKGATRPSWSEFVPILGIHAKQNSECGWLDSRDFFKCTMSWIPGHVLAEAVARHKYQLLEMFKSLVKFIQKLHIHRKGNATCSETRYNVDSKPFGVSYVQFIFCLMHLEQGRPRLQLLPLRRLHWAHGGESPNPCCLHDRHSCSVLHLMHGYLPSHAQTLEAHRWHFWSRGTGVNPSFSRLACISLLFLFTRAVSALAPSRFHLHSLFSFLQPSHREPLEPER